MYKSTIFTAIDFQSVNALKFVIVLALMAPLLR